MTMRCPMMSAHDMVPLSGWRYYCEEHGVTVILHGEGPASASPSPSAPVVRGSGPGNMVRLARPSVNGPVYVAKGRGTRYHVVPTCYTLGRSSPAPVVVVVTLDKAERDGKTPCLHCVPKN